jgi:hypothetical protein
MERKAGIYAGPGIKKAFYKRRVVNKDGLKTNKTDIAVKALKSVVGAAPYAGQLLCEVVEGIIPNQKLDRVIQFVGILDDKITHIEKESIVRQYRVEECSDLIEESLKQASRAISKERKEYIASVVSNALSSKDVKYNESKYILRILSEINDIEIIWLKSYELRSGNESSEFQEKHKDVLEHLFVSDIASQEIRDKGALQESYQKHLTQLGLLYEIYEKDKTNFQLPDKRHAQVEHKSPAIDTFTGGLKLQRRQITALGRLVLREIGL